MGNYGDKYRGLLLRSGMGLVRVEAGSGPAASNFLLLRQKKVTKEKATRSLGPLRCATGQPALLDSGGGPQNSPSAQTTAALIPPPSALLGPARTGWERIPIPNIKTNKDTPWRVLGDFGLWSSAVWLSLSNPLLSAPRSAGPGGSGIAIV